MLPRRIFLTHCHWTRFFTTGTRDGTRNRVALYLAQARLIDSIRLRFNSTDLSAVLDGLIPDSYVASHALRLAPSPEVALSLFQTLKAMPNFYHNRNTVHALAKVLSKCHCRKELQGLIASMNAGEYPNVLPPSTMDLLRWYAESDDIDSTLMVWRESRVTPSGEFCRPCTEAYNLLINLYAEKGMDVDAVLMFRRMIQEGANPNSRSFTIVIQHLARSGFFHSAFEIFEKLPSMRIRRTSKQHSILFEIFSQTNQFNKAKILIDDMRNEGILPNRTTRSVLSRMRELGFTEETNDYVSEITPDQRIRKLGVGFGFSLIDSEDEEDESDEDDNRVIARTSLKPWLDPSALSSALSDWNPAEVSALEGANIVWTTRLVCKLLRGFKKAETAWKFFCWVAYQPGGFTHDVYTISRMIVILARNGNAELVNDLISKVKREGIFLSFATVRLIIDSYGYSKKPDSAIQVFNECKSILENVESKSDLGLLHSSLLRTLIKCIRPMQALEFLNKMMDNDINPDLQTFSGMMQYFALKGDLRTVQQLFGNVRRCGLEPDAFMYQILIHAYCRSERAALALKVYDDMISSNLVPDLTTKKFLVKSLWREGKLREAAMVEEKSEEFMDKLPMVLPGHAWTVSSSDLLQIYNIYSNCFKVNSD